MAVLRKGTICNAVLCETVTALKKRDLEALIWVMMRMIMIRMIWEAHYDL
jgi:hypothetical protein